MSSSEVIKYIRRKTSTGFDEPISYLGAEQRFVGALRNCHNNNLEEQLLMGCDCYTEMYTNSEGTKITKKSFYIQGTINPTNYYYVISYEYKEDQRPSIDYFFEGDALRMPYSEAQVFGDPSDLEHPNPNALYLLDRTIFAEGLNKLLIFPDSYTIIRKDELHFIQSDGTDILVSTKTTGEKYKSDGVTKVITESIVNNL